MISKIYDWLMREYGPQGWWPLLDCEGSNPTKTGAVKGYHPGDYTYPKNEKQRFEICIGAILTQNTGWVQVEKALLNMKEKNLLSAKAINKCDVEVLKKLIKPTGYFNQKAKKLKIFSEFFLTLRGRTPKRKELLELWGIGPETADSMLLYAYKIPTFVVDAYTKRIFTNLGLIEKDAKYDKVKELFEKNLETDYKLFQEYHALIVEHAKNYYNKKPYRINDPLMQII